MAEAVILIGIPGAGKTTYFHNHFAATHVHISRDLLGAPSREAALLRESIAARRSFVIDNTNLTAAARAAYIAPARTAGYRIIACYFEISPRAAIGRNNYRAGKKPVPAPAILRMAKHLETPVSDEGFDEIHIVKIAPASA